MDDSSQVGEARRFAAALCEEQAFNEVQQGRAGIVVNELGNNLVKYARNGKLLFRKLNVNYGTGLEILAIDSGPGMDASRALRDGYTTGSTPGTGLGAVRRQSDVFDLYSQAETGTVILSQIFATDEAKNLERTFDEGAVCSPLKSEPVSGDDWATSARDGEISLLVADGLGHGLLANKAAEEALSAFRANLASPLDHRLQLIHGRLKSTRGAAVFLAHVRPSAVDFAGVGNIRAVIVNASGTKTLISQNGTAGLQMRSAKILTQTWNGDGYLILHSDGVTSRWDLARYPGILTRHPAILAGLIYRDALRGSDDATVVVIARSRK